MAAWVSDKKTGWLASHQTFWKHGLINQILCKCPTSKNKNKEIKLWRAWILSLLNRLFLTSHLVRLLNAHAHPSKEFLKDRERHSKKDMADLFFSLFFFSEEKPHYHHPPAMSPVILIEVILDIEWHLPVSEPTSKIILQPHDFRVGVIV